MENHEKEEENNAENLKFIFALSFRKLLIINIATADRNAIKCVSICPNSLKSVNKNKKFVHNETKTTKDNLLRSLFNFSSLFIVLPPAFMLFCFL